MLKKIIQTLTSYEQTKSLCVMGNEAVARGGVEAGVSGVFSYPGTPSTEISEAFKHMSVFQRQASNRREFPQLTANPIYFEYSINEKVALEKAIAYSIGGKSAMCCMKNVGMNVASDPLMTIAYQTIGAPLVLVVCDDPGCYSSSNEQDSRYWGKMASVPVFDPATPADALAMVKDAFRLSGRLALPVIVRMTTRVGHTRGMVDYGKVAPGKQSAKFERLPQHINIPARTATAHKNLLQKLKSEAVTDFWVEHTRVVSSRGGSSGSNPLAKLGVIASGVASTYATEFLKRLQVEGEIGFLKIGLLFPFPKEAVLKFLRSGFQRILVLEELDPIVENETRLLAQKNNLHIEIAGKGLSGLSASGEYNLDIVNEALGSFTGIEKAAKDALPLPDTEAFLRDLPPRPPALCPGCPHRATFYALKLAVPREDSNIVLCGDIGCFGLGALPPLKMIDTIHHMGMSISMAQGLSEAFQQNQGGDKFVALVGDGTFFHSGVASLLNAVYTRADIMVIIFDNRTIGMTGQQDDPGAPHSDKYNRIDLPALLRGMGVNYVATCNPFELEDTFEKINKGLAHEGVSVVVAQAPCLFLPENVSADSSQTLWIDHALCNTCFNQEDAALLCSKQILPKSGLAKARAKLVASDHIPAKEQSCPANICNHGFFNSILAGDYKEALNLVRDKMLFARVCGDICHKPCEWLYRQSDAATAPIRQLKHFVSGIDSNFSDFFVQKERVASAKKLGKSVAIVGAGPAGLSAAYDLIQCGYRVKVFEKEATAGGLLKFAIPDFRMDKAGFEREVGVLADLGVEFQFGSVLGKDFQVDALADEFDAVILAFGMGIYPTLQIVEENVRSERRYAAVSFLRRFNEKTLDLSPGATILVIGGGNSAMDAARSANRYDNENKVIVSCIESFEEMPAFPEEISSAKAEGIEIIDNSKVAACRADSDGKIRIRLEGFSDGTDLGERICDYIIVAIGQKGDASAVASAWMQIDDDGRIHVDGRGRVSNYPNVFAAGDICAGNHVSLIGAIAGGKKAAVGVRQVLESYAFHYEGENALSRLSAASGARPTSAAEDSGRFDLDRLLREIPAFDLFQACGRCNHCIDNFGCPALIKINGKVEIEQSVCTRCGLCVDVCLNGAIKWMSGAEALHLVS